MLWLVGFLAFGIAYAHSSLPFTGPTHPSSPIQISTAASNLSCPAPSNERLVKCVPIAVKSPAMPGLKYDKQIIPRQ